MAGINKIVPFEGISTILIGLSGGFSPGIFIGSYGYVST